MKPDGSKSWQLRYKKPDGQWSWLGLGGYGKGEHQLTGEQARRKVRELRDATTKDGSMLATKQAKKAAEAEAANNTFEHLARGNGMPPSAKHGRKARPFAPSAH